MTEFTTAERTALADLAALIIPASAEHGVPGADDPRIFAEIERALTPRRDQLAEALAALPQIAGETAEARGTAFRAAHPEAAKIVQTVVAECYYRDIRVLMALGMPGRPPFPKGHDMEAGDLSLLDPVREMPQRWRDA